MRDRSDTALEDSDTKKQELQSALEDAHSQLHELSLERDAMDEVLQKAARVAAQNERNIRIQLECSLAENAKLRETTVSGEREKAEHARLELEKERLETERLDTENAAHQCYNSTQL